jgi:hypothetical protein
MFPLPPATRGVEDMPGDPKECREHARECLRIATAATKEQTREVFETLASTWLRLATDLERGKALLVEKPRRLAPSARR